MSNFGIETENDANVAPRRRLPRARSASVHLAPPKLPALAAFTAQRDDEVATAARGAGSRYSAEFEDLDCYGGGGIRIGSCVTGGSLTARIRRWSEPRKLPTIYEDSELILPPVVPHEPKRQRGDGLRRALSLGRSKKGECNGPSKRKKSPSPLSLSASMATAHCHPHDKPMSLIVYMKDFFGHSPPLMLAVPDAEVSEPMRRCFEAAAACNWNIGAEDSVLNHTLKQEVLYMIDDSFNCSISKATRKMHTGSITDASGERIRRGDLSRRYQLTAGTTYLSAGMRVSHFYVFRGTL